MSRLGSFVPALALLALLCVWKTARAQVELRQVATFGAAGSGEITAYPSAVSRDSRGRYFVAVPHQLPLVFDANGRFLQSIGRLGDGPNEYRKVVRILVGAGDTLYLVDQWASRITVLSPELRLLRSIAVREYDNAVLLTDGVILATSDLSTSLRFDRVSPDGQLLPPYADPGPPCITQELCWRRLARALSSAPDGGFWAARRFHRYELERRSRTGSLVRVVRPVATWYSSYDSVTRTGPRVAPQASIAGLWEDSGRNLWVVGNTADSSWQDARWEQPIRREGVLVQAPVSADELLDGIIDVIDSQSGEVLWRRRIPQRIDGVARAGAVYSIGQDKDGFYIVRVFEVSLVRR
jgi:hypothetical protein